MNLKFQKASEETPKHVYSHGAVVLGTERGRWVYVCPLQSKKDSFWRLDFWTTLRSSNTK